MTRDQPPLDANALGPGPQPVINLDSCALLKFIKREPETEALHAWPPPNRSDQT